MQLQEILFRQGFGTRRACLARIAGRQVCVDGRLCTSPDEEFDPQGLQFSVDGQTWLYRERVYLMLHKPTGTECSHRPLAWPSVYSLLPEPLLLRPRKGATAGVQAVGRLDQDTSGLLLFTDDGALLHRLGSPRHHVPKTYEITTAAPFEAIQEQQLLAGVLLRGEVVPVRALVCERLAPNRLLLTLDQGKYHQVKRMIGAIGNRVEALHRTRFGPLVLPPTLAPAQFRWLTDAEVQAVAASA